jgi:hypothetical protein
MIDDNKSSVAAWLKWLPPLACLLLAGCSLHHRVQPQLTARHCAEGSYPVQAMYGENLVTVCAVIAPECAATSTKCPVVGVIPVGAVNTILDPDADEAAKDKSEKDKSKKDAGTKGHGKKNKKEKEKEKKDVDKDGD